MDLITIGAFARLTRLSPKALRLYDQLGLLLPAHVDGASGYRWYSPEQVDIARRVALLRQLDMPLARIQRVIALSGDDAAAELTAYWREQERRMATQRDLVGLLVDQLTGKRSVMYDVLVRDVPARTLLSIREHLTVDQVGEFAGPLFGLFGGPSVPRPTGMTGQPFLRYHGEVTQDSDGPVEFCCPVVESEASAVTARHPDMATLHEPASREAFVSVPKSDMTTPVAFESLRQWLADNDEELGGEPRQIFLADPAVVADADTVFQLAVPLR